MKETNCTNIIIGNLNLNLTLEIDATTKKVIVRNITQEFTPIADTSYTATRTLSPTEIRYKIMMFGKDASFAELLPKGEKITLELQGKQYTATCHRQKTGRIDSLSKFYADWPFQEGSVLEATYIPSERLMRLHCISLPDGY